MLRVFGLMLTAGLLLSLTACSGNQAANTNQNKSPNTNQNGGTPGQKESGNVASANATPPTNASTAQTAPMTAKVKNVGLAWKDDASGTLVTTIKVGGTVTWTKTGNHTLERVPASSDNGCDELEDSFNDDLENGSVTRTFTKAGTFGYHCGVHGGTPNCKTPTGSSGMAGVIKVVP